MNNVSLQFLGAAGTVTGSKHLLKTPDGNVLVDCGLFQGLKALRLLNWEALPLEVSKLKCVLLTHAHLDHCGGLPLLYKQGYRGSVYCTQPTRALVEIILRDSAKIQEEDAERANKNRYTKHEPAVPLYTEKDVENLLSLLQTTEENEALTITKNIQAVYKRNGHILGSVFIEVNCFGKTIVFSGDLGREQSLLLHAPTPPTKADFLVMESTYGDRLHSPEPIEQELANVIIDTVQRKGHLLIPSFAVGRAQELMHLINQLKASNKIPDVPVFMDSPMGADATQIFRKYPKWHKLTPDQCDAFFDKITIIKDFADAWKVEETPGSKIIIAASGMLTGGRILNYLEKYAESKRNTLLFTGYQAEGTRGRVIRNGGHEVKLHGHFVPIRLHVDSLDSMSGHGDQAEMINWLSHLKTPPQMTFLVHGENQVRDAFRVKIENTLKWKVTLPQRLEEVILFAV